MDFFKVELPFVLQSNLPFADIRVHRLNGWKLDEGFFHEEFAGITMHSCEVKSGRVH